MEVQSLQKKDGLKLVYLGNEIHEECIAHAQVVIKTEDTWHVIAPNPYRMHCTADIPMPEVKCPVVDISEVKDDATMRALMEKCTDKAAGVLNLAGLLTGLEALGAVMIQRVSESACRPELTSKYWDCECEENYIHPYYEAHCIKCGARREDQPDSHVIEVAKAGLPLEPVKMRAQDVAIARWEAKKKKERVVRRVHVPRKVTVH